MARRITIPPAGVMLLLAGSALLMADGVEGQSWRTVTASRQLTDESSLDVEVKYAAGEFRMRPSSGNVLYRMELRYDEDAFSPVNELKGNRLRLGIEGTSDNIRLTKSDAGSLDLDLARGVPMDLELDFGAVKADVDLGGIALTELRMATGASETTLDVSRPNPVALGQARLQVGAAQFEASHLGNLNARRIELDAGVGDITLDFAGAWERDADVAVDMGLGSLELRFPETLGVRLTKDSFLLKLDAPELVKRGESYYSPNWDEAERRVDVDVDAALGKLTVTLTR